LTDGDLTVSVQQPTQTSANISVGGMCTKNLGTQSLDAKLEAIKADGREELEEIKGQLLLNDAGVSVAEGCLLIIQSI
jgi:hypothetical protein